MIIKVESGFERGGSLLEWSGAGFVLLARARANTYKDDGDTSFVRELPAGFRGAVTRWSRGLGVSVELLGFSEAELAAPSPAGPGWAVLAGQNTTDSRRAVTFGDWAVAVLGGSFLSDASVLASALPHPVTGELLVSIPYYWGDQAASAWSVYSPSGEFIQHVSGVGDSAPDPIAGPNGWEFTSQAEERAAALAEEDSRFELACQRGNEHPDAAHIRACYKRGMNPLPSLRKAYGGTWKWYKSTPNDTGERDVLITEHPTPHTTDGYGWCVVFTPSN